MTQEQIERWNEVCRKGIAEANKRGDRSWVHFLTTILI